MDAKARVRAFLEQRLESGETELIFERLTAGQARAALETLKKDPTGDGTGNWRQTLRAAGAQAAGLPAAYQDPVVPAAPHEPAAFPAARHERPAFVATPHEPASVPANPQDPAHPRPGLEVGGSERELFSGPLGKLATLDEVAAAVASCTRCPLYQTATNPVPGTGNPNAGLVCVGEAPGATEDQMGEPFVGQAGQLLTKILAAINLSREAVFICNVLKHRPPLNRNPLPQEVQACSPYLLRQLELIRPKAILALGTFAAQTLLATKQSIGQLRGFIHRYHGIPLVVTYHPAALLRNPSWKRPAWEDVKLVRRILDSTTGP